MTFEEISNMQNASNIKFEVAKKIAKLLEEAEAKFDASEHNLDWAVELEAIQEMVFTE